MSNRRSRWSLALVVLLLVSNVMFGFPADMLTEAWRESKIVDTLYKATKDDSVIDKTLVRLPRFIETAHAANFSIQTGYYIGNGSTQTISGLGFQPQSVIIKAGTAAGQGVWKASVMVASSTAFFSATADDTSTMVTLNSDGFAVSSNANVNSANISYTWTAFAGSDCSASGTMCIGSFTGNGTNPRKITTGFQPAFVMVKRSTAVAGNFRTASMAANMGQYFNTTAAVTTGGLFTTFDSTGFNVGTTNNTSGGTFYYVAFKSVAGVMAEGTFTGDGVDNRNITGFGVGATPNLVIVKNGTSATASRRNPLMNNSYSYDDYASYVSSATASANNMIQKLQTDGFQIGTGVNTNELSQTMYWVAFGGAGGLPAGSGSFEMATGSYTGNGTSVSVTGLDFAPDLVIVKDNAANFGVFRTSLMAADNTAYLANAVANFTGGITSLTSDGFTIGASTVVNTTSNTYQWQAFGNAYKPGTRTGATDFAVGAYLGSGTDSRNINALPFQPDLVAIKRNGLSAGTWRSSANSGDQSTFFAATAEGANRVQSLSSFGYQIGTNANVNSAANVYNWFAFKNGSNFTVGTYTGTGGSQTVSTGFQPNLVWAKRNTTAGGTVHRGASLAGDTTQHFLATANFASGITSLVSNGFTLAGATAATNASGGIYRYAAWRGAPPGTLSTDIVDSGGSSVATPSVSFSNTNASVVCQGSTGTLGSSSQKVRVSNGTTNGNWSLTIAATGGTTANWSNGTNTYDFNDGNGTPNGCSDGGDTDSLAGQLTVDASGGTLTPQVGCSATGISKGALSAFSQGVTDAIALLSASSSQTNCYFDLTGVNLLQQIPGEMPASGSAYTINMTLTVTAN